LIKTNTTLNIKKLLIVTFFGIAITYYILLTPEVIVKIVKEEYIFISIAFFLFLLFRYYTVKLKDFTLISYIPDINNVDLKTTMIFFLIFQAVDYYYEDGFIGLISQWFVYWIFGVIAWLVTNNINLYKNYHFYKYESMSNKKL